MNQKEAEIVNEKFLKRDDVYNICLGGQGGFSYINENIVTSEFRSYLGSIGGFANTTEETRKKIKTGSNIGFENGLKIFNEQVKNGTIAREIFNSRGFLGKKHSQETKAKQSLSMKGKQDAEKNSQFGTMWITNGIENKKIKKDLDIIPDGWYKGKKCEANSKISLNQRIEIKFMRDKGMLHKEIAEKFGISRSRISAILKEMS